MDTFIIGFILGFGVGAFALLCLIRYANERINKEREEDYHNWK